MKVDLNRRDMRLLLYLIEDYMDYIAYAGAGKSCDIENLEKKMRDAIIECELDRVIKKTGD